MPVGPSPLLVFIAFLGTFAATSAAQDPSPTPFPTPRPTPPNVDVIKIRTSSPPNRGNGGQGMGVRGMGVSVQNAKFSIDTSVR